MVGLVDGLVVTQLDAWSGQAVGAFSSGAPLVRDHGAGVVPGVDGRIYQFDDDLEPRALPATAQELAAMDVPMMACENLPDTLVPASEGPAWRNCGILTSHRERNLFGRSMLILENCSGCIRTTGRTMRGIKVKARQLSYKEKNIRSRPWTRRQVLKVGDEVQLICRRRPHVGGRQPERVGVVAVAGLLKKETQDCMEEGSVGWECEQRTPPRFASLEVASTTTGYAVTAFDEDRIVWTTDLPAEVYRIFGASRTGAWSSLSVTAPRENSQALVAGPSVDLLAHAPGPAPSSDLTENAAGRRAALRGAARHRR